MKRPLFLEFKYCRGIRIGEIYEINKCAFFIKNEIYNLYVDSYPESDLELCFQPLVNGWRLLNQSVDIHCSVNGITLAPNHWCQLHEDDILEWGLSIWLINPTKMHISSEFHAETHEINEIKNEALPLDLTWFDSNMNSKREPENPYDLITSGLAYEVLETPNTEARISSNVESAAEIIFHELLKEYRQALDNSGSADNDYTWQDQLLQNYSSSSATNVNLTELSKNVDPLMTIQDMVTGPLHIDEVFNGLDSLREAELFQIEEPPEILRLFAPNWQQHNDHTQIPPILTRKEHHAVSVNSHYHMSHANNYDSKDSTNENNESQ